VILAGFGEREYIEVTLAPIPLWAASGLTMPTIYRTLRGRSRKVWVAALGVAVALASAAAIAAEPTPKAPAAKAGAGAKAKPSAKAGGKAQAKVKKQDLERWKRALESGTESEVRAALDEIAALGPDAAEAAPLVEGALGRGGSSAVMLAAIETAGRLGVASQSIALAPYVDHRNLEIRRTAAKALTQTGGPAAIATLRRALSGPDPAVRSTAAEGLGTLGAKEAVDDLFAVLDRGTAEAAVSIARLCAPPQCDRLMGLVGKLKFEVLEASFLPLFFRPDAELPEANKLAYVDQLRRIATKPAAAVLQSVLAKLPKDESPKLRAALQSALKARPIVGDSK
jgi:HEAT repeat protein